MEQSHLNWIANFIWGIADDVLRDLYVRGKYRDVILPMTVLRRLDAVLEPTKQAVLDMKASLDKAKIVHQDQALRQAAGQAFYNTSKFTLRDLKARASQQQLKADFEAYLDGFSPNVQEILDNFEFRNQIPRLSKADALGTLIEKLLSPDINLSPGPVRNGDGSVKYPGLDNHAMGTIFEELVRRFNEENNEEAGEHWTPRDAVKLMARLIFLPIADQIESGTYLLYDGACGTGGMLTVAEETLQQLATEHGKQVATHLYGQEINKEIKALKAEGQVEETAPPVIKKIYKPGKAEPDPLRGLFEATIDGKRCVVECEPDSDLRDTEQVPLLEPGGIEAFIRREVLPHAADAWYDPESVKTGYEVSFTRYFYKPQPLRALEEISADIRALEKETEGLLAEIIGNTERPR